MQEFLAQKRIAVAGVSRDNSRHPTGNLIYHWLKSTGHDVFPPGGGLICRSKAALYDRACVSARHAADRPRCRGRNLVCQRCRSGGRGAPAPDYRFFGAFLAFAGRPPMYSIDLSTHGFAVAWVKVAGSET